MEKTCLCLRRVKADLHRGEKVVMANYAAAKKKAVTGRVDYRSSIDYSCLVVGGAC
jgi:hypothetical protein